MGQNEYPHSIHWYPATREPTVPQDEETTKQELRSELDTTLRKDFLTQTNNLDRGKRHLEALNRAVSRSQIPAKLKINIQPQVYFLKEDPEFQNEWNRVKIECELKQVNVIRQHLRTRVIGKSQENM